jgi:hypothetical protein
MKYINHMTVAGEDEKIQALRDEFGVAGYGAYWLIVEKIAAQIRPESVSINLTLSWKKWGLYLDIRPSLARKMIESMNKVKLITLQSDEKSATIGIPNILKYADEYSKRVGIKAGQCPEKVPIVSGTPALLALPEQPTKEKGRRFTPPSLDEVRSYCAERRNNIDPQGFLDFYAAKGWLIGKTPMKDWRAAVRTWEKRNMENTPQEPKKYSCDQEKCTLEGKHYHYGRRFCRAHLPL